MVRICTATDIALKPRQESTTAPHLLPSIYTKELLGCDVLLFLNRFLHASPSPLILRSSLDSHLEFLRTFEWKIGMTKQLSSEEYDIRLVFLQDLVRLMAVRDQTDAPDLLTSKIILS